MSYLRHRLLQLLKLGGALGGGAVVGIQDTASRQMQDTAGLQLQDTAGG